MEEFDYVIIGDGLAGGNAAISTEKTIKMERFY